MILTSTIVLAIIGSLAALILYMAAKRFHVHEDPRIDQIESLLAGANCGGCGYSGCRAFAAACCTATSLEGKSGPCVTNEVMLQIADIVGLAPAATTPKVAVVRCNGTCENRPHTAVYDGSRSCAIEAMTGAGGTLCQYGCLGCGDCVAVCPYDAIHMDKEAGLPVVDLTKCVGCGKCVKACPRDIMELADNPGNHPIVYVECKNHDKGAAAMKECKVSCIGCMKCVKVCPTGAASVEKFLADINYSICTGCGACVEGCPRKSIISLNA